MLYSKNILKELKKETREERRKTRAEAWADSPPPIGKRGKKGPSPRGPSPHGDRLSGKLDDPRKDRDEVGGFLGWGGGPPPTSPPHPKAPHG